MIIMTASNYYQFTYCIRYFNFVFARDVFFYFILNYLPVCVYLYTSRLRQVSISLTRSLTIVLIVSELRTKWKYTTITMRTFLLLNLGFLAFCLRCVAIASFKMGFLFLFFLFFIIFRWFVYSSPPRGQFT